MEDDTDRRSGPEHRQDHFRDKPVHDDPDLDVAYNRLLEGKVISWSMLLALPYESKEWELINLLLQKNTFMMLPWVVLGLILVIGLLVSVIYTSIMFFVNSETINGILWLVIGFVAIGE